MEINDTSVEVLYDFEYSTKDGQKISIKEGEKLLLIKKTNNDWWQVIRSTGRRPFYVPSTYVRVIEGSSKEKNIQDASKKSDKNKSSPTTPPHNFTVSVNIKPAPRELEKKKKSSSKTKVMLNCDSDNEVLSEEKLTVLPNSTKSSDYSHVQVPKQRTDTLAEANILEDNLSGSLAEMAKEIKFLPSKTRTPEKLKYSGSFKTNYERKLLLRSFSGSTPDLTTVDNDEKDERDVGRIKSVEELQSDQENNIIVKGLKPVINIKSMGDIAEKLEKNMFRLASTNMSMSYVENNNLKDSTDSVGSGKTSAEMCGASSSDSIEMKPKYPVAKPRKISKPKVQEEIIYANCQELLRSGSPPSKVADIPHGWSAQVNAETNATCYVHTTTGDKMYDDSLWENNPLYSCHLEEVSKGYFSSLCDDALKSVGLLLFESRLTSFDLVDPAEAGGRETPPTEDLQVPEVGATGGCGPTGVSLNLFLDACQKLQEEMEALEAPSEAAVLSDPDFLRLCASALSLCPQSSLASSLDNNLDSASNLDYVSSHSTLPLTSDLSDEETSSESSDIIAWKWDIYMSAFDEYDFLIHDYNSSDSEWHSASDPLGRVYYFRENSNESSWTLPSLEKPEAESSPPLPQQQPPSPEPPHPQINEEMTAILNKISCVEVNSRKLRNAKAYSMMMISNKKEENEMTSSLKGWPELSDGRMPVVCEGPLHYTKICESGKRVRKNWTSVYVVLNELFLLIYKDIKAFHSFKGPPEVTLDLNGAEVSSGEKVSGRKHVLLVSTQEEIGNKVALQCENINSVLHWARNIQQTINNLPKASEIVKTVKLNMITEDPSSDDSRKGTNIQRSKSVNLKNKDDSMEDLGVSSAERQVKIRARLKKFFNKRPTMEALVKKGIWKDEPVFGSLLEQACTPNTSPRVPPFVQKCITVIESTSENMKTDGLYRASGNLSQIQKIRLQIDQHNYSVLEKEEDVHVLTGALKLFFRELKEPLIPFKLFSKAIKASTTPNKKERIHMFQEIVKGLPPANKDTLKFLLQHLLRVTQFQEHNRMHVANVAIVFGPTLMWPEQESSNMALDLMQQNMVIEALLLDYQAIFK